MPSPSPTEEDLLRQTDEKYNCRNPIGRWLLSRFVDRLQEAVSQLAPRSVLDVGCGNGHLTTLLESVLPSALIHGCDMSAAAIGEAAARRESRAKFSVASVYELPFEEGSFDVVTAFEVLEHLDRPEAALAEIRRVSGRAVVLSVPNEPIWRVLNIARGKNLRAFGNTPGHVQHWRPRGFRDFVGKRFRVIAMVCPLPWTVLVAEKRDV